MRGISWGAWGVAAGGATTLLLDHFTGTDGTGLGSHTMDTGPGWTVVTGSPEIQSNRASQGGITENVAVADSGQANVTVQMKARFSASGDIRVAIIGRYQDSSNYWMLDLHQSDGAFTLFEKVSNSFVSRASGTVGGGTINLNQDYALKLVMSGTSFTGTCDGANQITFTSSDYQSSTICGLRIFDIGTLGDDFQVTSP